MILKFRGFKEKKLLYSQENCVIFRKMGKIGTNGMTLVETLIVLLIIGILASLSVSEFKRIILKAHTTRAVSNIYILRNALYDYYVYYSKWPQQLHVNTYEPLVSAGLIDAGKVKVINSSLEYERLQAYVLRQNGYVIFFKPKNQKIQFFLFVDGVYYRDPKTNEIVKF